MLIFEDKLPAQNRPAIIKKLYQVSANLGINVNWLMAVINFETAGTFSPSIQNKHSNATGLIQFMPSTARGLGTTIEALKYMDFETQLNYVEKHFKPYKSKIKGFVDLYFATFFPVAIGKPDSFIIQTSKTSAEKIASQNTVFDTNKDSQLTVGEIKKVILTRIPIDYLKYVITQPENIVLSSGLLVFLLIGVTAFLVAK